MARSIGRHPWYLAGIAALAAVVVLALVLFGGGEDADGPFAPIAEAAEKTARVPGAKIEITGELEIPERGTTIEMAGTGMYNGRTDRSFTTMRVTGGVPEAQQFTMTQVAEGFVMYQRLPFEDALPDDKTWMKIDLSELADAPSLGAGGGLKQQFEQLKSVSPDARDLGTERVRGVETVHYAGTVDLRLQAEQLREAGQDDAAELTESVIEAVGSHENAIEVWIDRKGYLRRMTAEIPFGIVTPGTTMRMTQELYDFGVTPKIDLPPEDDVYNATELAREQLEAIAE